MSITSDPSTWRRSVGTVKYRLKDGPVITSTDEETTATETYVIQASDVTAFQLASFPPPVFLFGRAWLPQRRRMPGATFLATKQVEFRPLSPDLPGDPLSADTGAATGTYNQLYQAIIQYSSKPDSEDDSEPFLEHSFSAGAQILSIPANKTQIQDGDVSGNTDDGATPTEDAPEAELVTDSEGNQVCIGADGVPSADLTACNAAATIGALAKEENPDQRLPMMWQIPTIEHTIRRKFVPAPNFAALFALVGRCNRDQTATLFRAKRETVLFSGVTGRQSFVWDGATSRAQPWTIELKFTEVIKRDAGLTYGWNHVYSPSKGKWVRVTRPNGRPLYYTFKVQDVLNAIF